MPTAVITGANSPVGIGYAFAKLLSDKVSFTRDAATRLDEITPGRDTQCMLWIGIVTKA